MKNQKPRCNCGGELEYIKIITCREITKIKKNGEFSNINRIRKSSYQEYDAEWLECIDCFKQYDFDEKNGKVIILGERKI